MAEVADRSEGKVGLGSSTAVMVVVFEPFMEASSRLASDKSIRSEGSRMLSALPMA